ncbi:MAG: ABC transporter permease [Actinomycetota bacterium]
MSNVYRFLSIAFSLAFVGFLVFLAGASPLQVAASLWNGAFGTLDRVARVFSTLVPLLLSACGLVFTFAASLYNLGIEGQITMGAISTTFALRIFPDFFPAPLGILLGIIAGIIGGTLWGLLTGIFNINGKISEIFVGLGLNFIAQGLALYLVFGPWKRPGIASMSGTELFNESLWLPALNQTEASPIALILAALGLLLTVVVMRGTYFGLQLRAVGQNFRAAYLLGIPATQQLLNAFGICGAFAGLAGALQVLAVFHRLIPSISSNFGFLGLLVVMLAGSKIVLLLPISLFFSALNIGSLQLPLTLNLESSLAGVIQGMLVLFVILSRGFTLAKKKQEVLGNG